MRIVIKQATIISTSSPFNGKIKDILIEDGIITKIADSINDHPDKIIQQDGLCVSPGWMDIFANFADPGFEYKETIETGAKAAAAGGFTDVMLIPNCNPVTDNKSQTEYIKQKAQNVSVNIYPIGAITKNIAGKELSEMYDMRHSGAVAFSDGILPIQNSGLLLKALQYVKSFNGTVIQLPDDTSIGMGGLMNEGIISTQMGLPGKPIIAEELMVARDLKLARYADSRIHFTGISSPKSLEYIKRSKESGINVTCSITPYQVFFCDEDLQGYDSNLKLNPPVRSKNDKDAIKKALLDGTIDCIASHHLPQHNDNKNCEFEFAKPGMISLQTMFAAVNSIGLPVHDFVKMQTVNARNIFGLTVPEISEGQPASLTFFNPGYEYIFNEEMIQSKSKNTAFIGKKLTGKVIGIINKSKIQLN
ncbi:MAG: dihydroorotase [Ferruginibacter sp.]|nr:dihydroorotase [Bacteroidota bacterium]MBX2919940.1 dihydroorotase [Ferruginibacter sp.]MCB0710338.1 dihydroorotase [Chitinophagaceae bacterium]